jgi:hypothetical protein
MDPSILRCILGPLRIYLRSSGRWLPSECLKFDFRKCVLNVPPLKERLKIFPHDAVFTSRLDVKHLTLKIAHGKVGAYYKVPVWDCVHLFATSIQNKA